MASKKALYAPTLNSPTETSTLEKVHVTFEWNGEMIEAEVLAHQEDLEAYGTREEYLEEVRTRTERILGMSETITNLNLEGTLKNQAKKALIEKPPEISYKEYQKWCQQNGLNPVEDLSLFMESIDKGIPSIMKRFWTLKQNDFINPKDKVLIKGLHGTRTGGRYEIIGFTAECMIMIRPVSQKGSKNPGKAEEPRHFKLRETTPPEPAKLAS